MNYYIIRCTSGREQTARKWLKEIGYCETWVPMRRMLRRADQVMRDMKRCKSPVARKRIKRFEWKPWVYGYIFVKADHIDVAKIRYLVEDLNNLWMEVLVIHGKPVAVSHLDMLKMKAVPANAKKLIDDLNAQAEAEARANELQFGDEAVIIDGPFIGQTGLVVERDEAKDRLKIELANTILDLPKSFVAKRDTLAACA